MQPETSAPPTERGSALITTLIMITILLGTLSLLMGAMVNQSKHSGASEQMGRALLAAENGFAQAKVKVLEDPTAYDDAVDVVVISNATCEVTITDEGDSSSTGFYYRIVSTGTVGGRSRSIEVLVDCHQATVPISIAGGNWPAALVGTGDIELDDNVHIDGNDNDPWGSNTAGTDFNAVDIYSGSISVLDDSGVWWVHLGANGLSPVWTYSKSHASSGDRVREPGIGGAPFWKSDGVDNDFDGDTDADNAADEDFPQRVGHLFGYADETILKEAAQATGTFFTSFGDYKSWVDDVGTGKKKNKPAGKILYLELDNTGSSPNNSGHFHLPRANPGDVTGESPTLVIVTGSDAIRHNIELDDVHIRSGNRFNGVFIADSIETRNSNGRFAGAMFLFSENRTSYISDDWGIYRSSEVLNNLPGVPNPGVPWEWDQLMWREFHPVTP